VSATFIQVGGYWWPERALLKAHNELIKHRSGYVPLWDACLYLVLPYWAEGATQEEAIAAYFTARKNT
jgi:hypothetical protein